MTVTFILLAHNQINDAYVSVGSILAQTNPNWRVIVLNNGPNTALRYLIATEMQRDFISYVETPEFIDTDTYNRQKAFQMSESDITVCGSISDYFLPTLVQDIIDRAEGKDLIYWDGYNHHWVESEVMKTSLECRNIDWCNFAVRTELARLIPIRHREAMADGYFVEDFMKHESKPVAGKIGKMLVVHT